MIRETRAAIDVFDASLDDLVSGRRPRRPAPIAPGLVDAAQRFHAAADALAVPTPDPSFADHTEARLMRRAAAMPVPLRPGPDPRSSPGSLPGILTTFPRRWTGALEVVAAAVLAVALLGGAVIGRSLLAGIATPPLVTESGRGAEFGRAPVVAPGVSTPASGSVPVRLVIPAANVDARVEAIEATTAVEGVRRPPPTGPRDVAWYVDTAPLGAGGNTVLFGHVDYWETGPAVFADLANLEPGDRIALMAADGETYNYAVTSVRSYRLAALSDGATETVVGPTGGERLTVITEGGVFDGTAYLGRVVVRAERVASDEPSRPGGAPSPPTPSPAAAGEGASARSVARNRGASNPATTAR